MKKGFTLIELLAVIIILAVIALIATPIVLNIVESAKKNANKNSVYGIMDSAKLYYAESLLDSSKSSNINGRTNLINEIKVSGKKSDSGVLYINNKGETALALVYDNVCYKKNFTENNLTESEDIANCTLNIEETTKICRATEGTGKNIDDEITCGTESFYVYAVTANSIKMYAKYPLKVGYIYDSINASYSEMSTTETGYGLQDTVAELPDDVIFRNLVPFSSDSQKGTKYSDYEGSIVKGYVDSYATKLRNMGVNVIDASIPSRYNEAWKSLSTDYWFIEPCDYDSDDSMWVRGFVGLACSSCIQKLNIISTIEIPLSEI